MLSGGSSAAPTTATAAVFAWCAFAAVATAAPSACGHSHSRNMRYRVSCLRGGCTLSYATLLPSLTWSDPPHESRRGPQRLWPQPQQGHDTGSLG